MLWNNKSIVCFLGLIFFLLLCKELSYAFSISKRYRVQQFTKKILVRAQKSEKMSWAGQSVNIPGILSFGRVLVNPSIAIPHISVPHISYLNFETLHQIGIRAVVFDKDNTLTAPYVDEIHPLTQRGLEQCRRFFNDSMVILSNSAGTNDDVGFESADRISAALKIPVVRHSEKKPGGLSELMACFSEDIRPDQVCVIGDRLLTDILFGNLYGMLTVHCQPLTLEGDNKVAKYIRYAESWTLIRQFRDRFHFRPQNHPLLENISMEQLIQNDDLVEEKN
mmetsp:Transcript_3025/g.4321  ORF Transcript_3025/g.4321 Transcript_3025/m.4321 type:complete len:279 (+) Transcript_3025:96-932(+)